MVESFGWGLLGASSLLIGAVVALAIKVSHRAVGLVMAFGAGVLISAVAFDLVEEGFALSSSHTGVITGLFAGCAVFFVGDTLIDRKGGGMRKKTMGGHESGSALAIVLGIVLDGIPESMVIGLTILESGSVGAAFLVAVFISNFPEALASTRGFAQAGWQKRRIFGLWAGVALVSALAAAAGYGLLEGASPDVIAFVLAFAGGAILTMLADTMMPEAYEHGGKLAGVITTLGFAVAFTVSTLA